LLRKIQITKYSKVIKYIFQIANMGLKYCPFLAEGTAQTNLSTVLPFWIADEQDTGEEILTFNIKTKILNK